MVMNPERYRKANQVLQQALSQPPERIESFLKEACEVDQFAELFTLNPIEVRARFAALLGRLASEADVHVLISCGYRFEDDALIGGVARALAQHAEAVIRTTARAGLTRRFLSTQPDSMNAGEADLRLQVFGKLRFGRECGSVRGILPRTP